MQGRWGREEPSLNFHAPAWHSSSNAAANQLTLGKGLVGWAARLRREQRQSVRQRSADSTPSPLHLRRLTSPAISPASPCRRRVTPLTQSPAALAFHAATIFLPEESDHASRHGAASSSPTARSRSPPWGHLLTFRNAGGWPFVRSNEDIVRPEELAKDLHVILVQNGNEGDCYRTSALQPPGRRQGNSRTPSLATVYAGPNPGSRRSSWVWPGTCHDGC